MIHQSAEIVDSISEASGDPFLLTIHFSHLDLCVEFSLISTKNFPHFEKHKISHSITPKKNKIHKNLD
jgi:hypothetical protein